MSKSPEIIFLVEESAEGGYEARALSHAIHTQGENLDELKAAIRDAVKCHFEEQEIPRAITARFPNKGEVNQFPNPKAGHSLLTTFEAVVTG